MNKREQIICALRHEESIVPVWPMGFENIETAKRLIGDENVPKDLYPDLEYKNGASDLENRQLNV